MSNANLQALRAALTGDFKTRFAIGDPAAPPFPVRYENQPFVQPKASTWGAFSIALSDRNYSALGGVETRTMGIAFLQIFQVEEAGTKAAFQAADIMAAMWDGVTLLAAPGASVLFRTVGVKRIGATSPGWYQHNVEAPFQFDVITLPAGPAVLGDPAGEVLEFGGGIAIER